MKRSASILLPLIALFAGCTTVHTVPAVGFDCIVLDVDTRRPITGASVTLRYVALESVDITHGPLITNTEGCVRFATEKREVRLSLSAGFNGGYSGHLEVKAEGYENTRLTDGDLATRYRFKHGREPEWSSWPFFETVDILLQKKKPNKAPEPTPGSVTGRADARPAPAPVVAHL